jgi:RsmE family RNA methyltransferase
LNILLLERDEVDALQRTTLTDLRAEHLRTILKVAPGQAVRIGLIDGPFGSGRVIAVDPASVTLDCEFDSSTPPRPDVDLLLAVPRPKVLRRLWPQLAALGVGRVLLSNAARVERHYFDTHFLSAGIYRPLLIDGLQQARDTRLPIVSIHRQFRVLIEDDLDVLSSAPRRLVADPGSVRRISDVVPHSNGDRVLLAVGPEGGWNRFELDLLETHGFEPVGIGPRTLRSDTACVALLAIVHDALRGRS